MKSIKIEYDALSHSLNEYRCPFCDLKVFVVGPYLACYCCQVEFLDMVDDCCLEIQMLDFEDLSVCAIIKNNIVSIDINWVALKQINCNDFSDLKQQCADIVDKYRLLN